MIAPRTILVLPSDTLFTVGMPFASSTSMMMLPRIAPLGVDLGADLDGIGGMGGGNRRERPGEEGGEGGAEQGTAVENRDHRFVSLRGRRTAGSVVMGT